MGRPLFLEGGPGTGKTSLALALARLAEAVRKMRGLDLLKPPGVAESLDWARAPQALGRAEPDATTLGAVLKYREDAERVLGSTIVG